MKKNRAKNGLYSYLWALAVKTILKMIHFSSIIESMRHFLGSVGVRGSVRGPFFTRHPVSMCACALLVRVCEKIGSYLFSLAVSMCV